MFTTPFIYVIIYIILYYRLFLTQILQRKRDGMDYLKEIEEIWSMVKESLSKKISTPVVNLWFGNSSILSYQNDTVTIGVESEFKKERICEKYIPLVEDVFEEIMGFHVTVNIRANVNSDSHDELKFRLNKTTMFDRQAEITSKDTSSIDSRKLLYEIEDRKKLMSDKKTGIGSTMPSVNFEYTFDNFIVGGSNKFAHAACFAVSETPAQDYNPLFIYGPSGLGKTHLLYAVTNKIKERNPDAKIIYIKSEDFTNQMIESLSKNAMGKFRDKYRTCDVLLIDDIQFIAGKESTQEEFFHTFNALFEAGKQIILTSDRPPKDIKTLEERLVTRFEWGLIADIQPPDLELRIAILKNKIEQAGLEVSDEIITYLAENLRSHIRQIEGAVKKLVAIRFLSGREITMEIAKNCINELLGGEEPINVTVDKIFASIEKKFGVKKSDLTGKSRVKEIAHARHVAIFLIRDVTEMSYPNIGKLFNRDHTTIIASEETVRKKLSSDRTLEATINEILKEIKE